MYELLAIGSLAVAAWAIVMVPRTMLKNADRHLGELAALLFVAVGGTALGLGVLTGNLVLTFVGLSMSLGLLLVALFKRASEDGDAASPNPDGLGEQRANLPERTDDRQQ